MLTAFSILAAVLFALVLCAFDHFFTRFMRMKRKEDENDLLAFMREINDLETIASDVKRRAGAA